MLEIATKAFAFKNKFGDTIKGDLRYPPESIKAPLIVFSHGFKACKEWGFIPYVCDSLAKSGALVVNFDFSLNGVIESATLGYDADIFAKNTISRQLSDIDELVTKLTRLEIEKEIIESRFSGIVYLAGHSLGGAMSILTAEKFESIRKIAVIGTPIKIDRFTTRQKEIWRKRGVWEFALSATKQKLKIDVEYINDLERNAEIYSLKNAVALLKKPLAIIHGAGDITVNKNEAYDMAYAYPDKKNLRFELIEKAGHGFGAEHPFVSSNPAIEKMIFLLQDYFELNR